MEDREIKSAIVDFFVAARTERDGLLKKAISLRPQTNPSVELEALCSIYSNEVKMICRIALDSIKKFFKKHNLNFSKEEASEISNEFKEHVILEIKRLQRDVSRFGRYPGYKDKISDAITSAGLQIPSLMDSELHYYTKIANKRLISITMPENSRYVKEQRLKELDPWQIISSFLSGLLSDQVTQIIGRTGLPIGWTLSKGESYSHKTRIRAYLPRIIEAYSRLQGEDQLRVAWIVAKEIADLGQDYAQNLNEALRAIGWRLESDKLTTGNAETRELFFPKGATHDAYVEIRKVLQLANVSIEVVDPYIDESIFQMFKAIPVATLSVKLLSCNLPADFAIEAKKFVTQHFPISFEIRKTKEFHDRFIIINSVRCYHLGASIKDAGGKAFMLSQVEDQYNIDALLLHYKQSWDDATPFTY